MILYFFRKKPFILVVAEIFLIFSCSQYDLNETRSFSYALYKTYKEQNIKLDYNLTEFNKSKILQKGSLLQIVNSKYGANLIIPDHIQEAMTSITDIDDIKAFVVKEGLLTNQDVKDLQKFINKAGEDGFQPAIDKFENDIVNRSVSESELQKYDNIASAFKIINDENPKAFNNIKTQSKGLSYFKTVAKANPESGDEATLLDCLIAYLWWVASLIGVVAGCTTVFLCVLALLNLGKSTIDIVLVCGEYEESQF